MRASRVSLFILAAFLIVAAKPAQAGTFYTDQGIFNQALLDAGLVQTWSEDFEGFSMSPLPVNVPTVIAGGLAQIAFTGSGDATQISVSGSNQFWDWVAFQSFPKIEGIGGSLGVSALSFDAATQQGSQARFIMEDGSAQPHLYALDDPSWEFTFLGWIANPGDALDYVYFSGALLPALISLDNITAYTASQVPAPGTILLLASGYAGLLAIRRRQHN